MLKPLAQCAGTARCGAALILALLFASLPGTSAQAQNVDWLVSVEDTGFDPVDAGDVINYTVLIDNNGVNAAPVTTLDFDIPAGARLVGTSGDLTGCLPATGNGPLTMTCDVPVLASGGQFTQIVQVTETTPGILPTIEVFADIPTTGDVLTTNNDDNELTTILSGADIELSLTVPATAASGSTISFVWEMTNNGPNASSGFTLEFPVPTGIANMVAPAGCTESGGVWRCVITGTFMMGDTVTRTFTGQVSRASSSDVTVSASVIDQNQPDPDASNDTATGSVTVAAGTDVAIEMTRIPGGNLLIGDTVTFELATSYTGDAPSGLTVTDVLPGNYSITSVNAPAGWSCSTVGQTVTCTNPGGGAAGANQSLGTIEIVTQAITAGNATNTATIAAASPTEQNLSNNTDSDGGATISVATVDLQADKVGVTTPVVQEGDGFDYRISVTNVGTADFIGTAVMQDTLPAGLTLNSVSQNGWSCAPTAGTGPVTVTCTRVYTAGDPLGANQTSQRVTLRTTTTTTGTITNSMTVSSPDANIADGNGANDTITYDITVSAAGASADLAAAKSVTPGTIVAGEIATFTLEMINNGPQPAANVAVEDIFYNLISNRAGAVGEGFVGFTINDNGSGFTNFTCASSGRGTNGRRLTCNIDALPVCTAGVDCPTVVVQVRPGNNGGSYSNTFDLASATTLDPDMSNNEATVSYTLDPRADMTVTVTANPDPVAAGQDLTYIVTAVNADNELSAAEGVQIVDTLPIGVTFVSAVGPSATCTGLTAGEVTTAGNRTITCDMGTIANGAQRSATIIVRPNNATAGTTIVNDVTVSTTTTELDLTNNSDSISVGVGNPETDILVNKIDDVDPLTIGGFVNYTVTVTNAGPSASENVVVTDTLPTSLLSYTAHSVSGAGTCSVVPAVDSIGGTLVCSWPYLPADESETLIVTMEGQAAGVVDNNVEISSDEIVAGFDTLASNNVTSQDTTIGNRPDVSLTKSGPAGPVGVTQPFDWTIEVTVNGGSSLADATEVTVTDTLPANMELTGAPTASLLSGTATLNTCSGVAGDTALTCQFGTVSSGGLVQITVPVQITAITTNPETFTNTATVTTTSFDQNPANNSDSASISAGGSSLAGSVFRDFADDAVQNGSDTGIAGIELTITGFDAGSTPITPITVTTDANGDYLFPTLPEGTFTVTRGVVNEPYLVEGQNTPGSEGGTTPSGSVIASISLPANTAATGYDFAEVPQARVGLAKALSAPVTTNADNTITATFDVVVENFSLEPLTNIAVTDDLDGATPLFGTYNSPADPINDPIPAGSYTITGPPSGTCGGLNAGFTGAADPVVASGFALGVGASCTLSFSIRVNPVLPLPPGYENQAEVDAVGQLSGQTSATNPQLADLSDDGTEPDADGDNQGNEVGENDPTPVVIDGAAPAIALIKDWSAANFSTPPAPGDQIEYTFEVHNTGNVTLTNITLTDILPGIVISGGPIASLAAGAVDTTTYTATYAITQADITAGEVINQATVTGTPPLGADVTDLSGTTVSEDDPTITPITQVPAITLDKIADDSQLADGAAVGEVITYAFTVTNTGNLPLTDVTITDALPGVVLSGGPIPLLNPGDVDSATYTATYTIDAGDIAAGEVVNVATVTGTYGPNPGDEVSAGDSETVPIAAIQAVPEVFPPFTTDGGTTTSMLASDLLNNGPATLANVTITVLASDPGVTLDPATALITLDPGMPAGEYTAEYQICSQAAPTLCDTTVETVVQAAIPAIEVTKTQVFTDNGDTINGIGDTVTYTITVDNTGNLPLDAVRLEDTFRDLTGAPLTLDTGPDFVSADMASLEGRLEIGEIATYTASYVVTAQAMTAGGLENQAEGFGTPDIPAGVPGDPSEISDLSDDGNDLDGNTTNDPTQLILSAAVNNSGVTLSKTTPSEIVRRGDVVTYTITITNDNAAPIDVADIIDTLPASILYIPDSATFQGAPFPVNQVGRRVQWFGITVPANGAVTATLQARVLNGARAGEHVNNVSIFDSATGALIVGPAQATVRILPEAVFDCGDVIGKVFEDHDGDGYQDPYGERDGAISDQTYHADKYGKYEVAPLPVVEKGIPGVRLIAPDGTIITTDANGLYSVPCAALPLDRGSNYILKLDERTLPLGFRPTTENPRVVRLTPGMMSEVNFGAAPGQVVNIALNRAAFALNDAGRLVPSAALQTGITQMVDQLAGQAVVIRLAWHVGYGASAAEVQEGRQLMALVDKAIRKAWRWKPGAPVRIVTTIVRGGE